MIGTGKENKSNGEEEGIAYYLFFGDLTPLAWY